MASDTLLASWRSTTGEEHLMVRDEGGGWTAELSVTASDVLVVVRLDESWRVRQFLLFRDLEEPDLWLATDGRGHWGEVNGARREDLDGVAVVALADTAFVHSLVLRAGGIALVAEVDPETLQIEVLPRRYEALGQGRWRHADAEWTVDDDLLPHDLPGTHTRTM